ncbi:sensor histidine kinase [Shewanella sp.]|uniref:sensor histidine kinase n=2 Tax=Shewanella sp. TaxID=50422 RepID=UPI0040542164
MTFLTKSRQRKALLSLFLCLGLAVSLSISYWYLLTQGTAHIAATSTKQLNELVLFWRHALDRYETIPKVLSNNPLLADALKDNKNKAKIDKLNHYLQEIQQATHASDIYLIDAQGITLAASNWQLSDKFINQDYSFRPYFIDALKGEQGRYYAVGTASDKRGYYFSYPVSSANEVLGVIVVKMDIDALENQSLGMANASGFEFMISDPDDVVFLASINSWRYAALTPLTQNKRHKLNASKRYATRSITELSIKPAYVEDFYSFGSSEQVSNAMAMQTQPQVFTINLVTSPKRYLKISETMPAAKWRVHILAPMSPLYNTLPTALLLAGTLYLLFVLAIIYSFERRRYYSQMSNAKEQLEQRVKLRTAELEHSNHKLKHTQEELIQAAKLTVIGSLSASINHELNQPLAALRSYAQNTQAFMQRNMIDKANENIHIMIQLTDRLADIIGQFKSFTRKSQGQDNAVEIATTITQALVIVKPEIEKCHITLRTHLPSGRCQIWGDGLRLQQVLVNLMTNAIAAMEHTQVKTLAIKVRCDNKIIITIQDSGPGVMESQLDKIFEPYFTTSERQGLGLGLSISERIIGSMQGSITVENASQGGAIFSIILPAHLIEKA